MSLIGWEKGTGTIQADSHEPTDGPTFQIDAIADRLQLGVETIIPP
jgi:hypothetical protein